VKAFALSVPANLLLLGEYAVTEEGGRGIALAASPRLRVEALPDTSLSIRGSMGPTSFEWREDSGLEAPPLLAACIEAAGRPPCRLRIDSSAFFTAEGAKRGYGSSAAVAVGLVAALLRARGLEGSELENAVFPLALAAHRSAQGGRGSGYDVAASRFGGLGLFVGGPRPSWRALHDVELPPLYLFQGPAPVSSPESVARFRSWKAARPEELADYLAASGSLAEAFLAGQAPGTQAAKRLELLAKAAALGRSLGLAIGVPADLDPPPGLPRGTVIKALGAGNELGLAALTPGSTLPTGSSLLPLHLESEGLRWE